MEEQKVIDIEPISKWKRFIVYLGDISISFIVAVLLFIIAIYPISCAINNNDAIKDELISQQHISDDIFYDNSILFYENELTKYDYENSLEHTYKKFLSKFVNGESDSNDVIYNYFITLKNDESYYKSLFSEEYFNIEETISLKENYVEILSPLFDENDVLTEYGESIYETILNDVFLNMYSKVIIDVKSNNLTSVRGDYLDVCVKIEHLTDKLNWSITISSFISYLISSLILFLLVPILSGNKTILMMIMHFEKIGVNNLYLLGKKEVICAFVYKFVLGLFVSFFVSLGTKTFVGLFDLPILFPVCAISLIGAIASLFVLLFNEFNKDLEDVLSRSVLVNECELTKIYEAKGYLK